MKGILIIYVNYHPDNNESREDSINFVYNQNKELIEAITKETDYRVMFIPTTEEACRVRRIDLDRNDNNEETEEIGETE